MIPFDARHPLRVIRWLGCRRQHAVPQGGGAMPEAEARPASVPLQAVPPSDAQRVPRLPQGVVQAWPVGFEASAWAYARLWLVCLLGVLLTAGLYAPWAHVRTERFLMRHTTVAGHPLDYHATARSLWPRHALGACLLLGLAGAWAGSTWAGLLALTLVLAAWPLMVHMALVHRLAHLSWDRRRLAFGGHAQGVYGVLGGPVATLVLLAWGLVAACWWPRAPVCVGWGMLLGAGLVLLPTAVWAWLQYRQHRVRLGPLALVWQASVAEVQALCVRTVVWALLLAALVAGVVALCLAACLLLKVRLGAVVWGVALAALAMLWAVACLAFAQARLQNLVWRRTGCRHLRFRSQLHVAAHVRLQLRHAVWLCLTAGLYWPWAVVATRRMRAQALTVHARVDAEVLKAHWAPPQRPWGR